MKIINGTGEPIDEEQARREGEWMAHLMKQAFLAGRADVQFDPERGTLWVFKARAPNDESSESADSVAPP